MMIADAFIPTRWLIVLLAIASASAQDAVAPQPVFPKPQQSTMAMRDKPVLPVYPMAQRRSGEEGWVVLSYVVTADGTVVDPIVEDSSGQPAFERAALKAASSQHYIPATVDGKAVEQCVTDVRYSFSIPGTPRAARHEFGPKYGQLRALIDSGDLVAARTTLAGLLKTGSWNNYEASRLYLLRYDLCKAINYVDCQLESLKRATSGDGANLEPALYRSTLVATAVLEIESDLYANALATIDLRNALRPPLEPDHPLMKAATQIRRQIAGEKNLVFAGKIGLAYPHDNGVAYWRHQLLRRSFALSPEQGKLDRLEVRCDWRRTTDIVSADKVWNVPDNWGNCIVFVFGEADATFRLVEYPVAAL